MSDIEPAIATLHAGPVFVEFPALRMGDGENEHTIPPTSLDVTRVVAAVTASEEVDASCVVLLDGYPHPIPVGAPRAEVIRRAQEALQA